MNGQKPQDQKVLYVGAIPFGADEKLIKNLFEPHGTVEAVHVVADWGNPTFEPHAFVVMPNALRVIDKMDGKKVGNTYLRVHEGVGYEAR